MSVVATFIPPPSTKFVRHLTEVSIPEIRRQGAVPEDTGQVQDAAACLDEPTPLPSSHSCVVPLAVHGVGLGIS